MTKEQWANLTPKAQWDIMVALRGPDLNGSNGLKWITASVIRGEMQNVFRVGGLVNSSLHAVFIPNSWGSGSASWLYPDPDVFKGQWGQSSFGLWSGYHFFEHIITAASHLNIPGISVDDAVYREAIKKGHGNYTIAQLYTYFAGQGSTAVADIIKKHMLKEGMLTYEG